MFRTISTSMYRIFFNSAFCKSFRSFWSCYYLHRTFSQRLVDLNSYWSTSTPSNMWWELYWGFLCTFHSLQRTKKILKSLQRKRRNCERTKMIILTVFMLKLKDFYHKFQFSVVNRNHSRSNTLVLCIFFNFNCRLM